MAEPPYGVIWNRLKAGKVIPFLGAGASFVGRPQDAEWDPYRPAFLPSGAELASFLAEETRFPSSSAFDIEDLAKVSSYYSDVNGRPVLRERLRELLHHDYPCGALHGFLAELPGPVVIVVTNYDTLLEQAMRAAGKPYDLVVHATDRKDFANAVLWWPHGAAEPKFREPNRLDQDIDLATTTVIYKMHGTIHRESNRWDNFVITEEDYVDFLARMTSHTAIPSLFIPHFRERSFLFLGYSLRDWNLRVILKNLRRDLRSRVAASDEEYELIPSWAIQRKPSELERKLWETRGVNIFDISIDSFVSEMQTCRRP